MSSGPITGDANFDHLCTVVYASFLHCRITCFPFMVVVCEEISEAI